MSFKSFNLQVYFTPLSLILFLPCNLFGRNQVLYPVAGSTVWILLGTFLWYYLICPIVPFISVKMGLDRGAGSNLAFVVLRFLQGYFTGAISLGTHLVVIFCDVSN